MMFSKKEKEHSLQICHQLARLVLSEIDEQTDSRERLIACRWVLQQCLFPIQYERQSPMLTGLAVDPSLDLTEIDRLRPPL